jgi:hypothetical protein
MASGSGARLELGFVEGRLEIAVAAERRDSIDDLRARGQGLRAAINP